MPAVTDELYETLCEVPLDLIDVNPAQPRRKFAPEALEELAQSIQAVGLIHPPTVLRKEDGRFELIAGERRCRAAKMAGFFTIPVLVRKEYGDTSEEALIENVQRVDLNPMEVAHALKDLETRLGLNQEQLADRIGKKRSTVANYLRLLSLPESIATSVSSHIISMGHAKVILSLDTLRQQLLLHEIILRDQLTVRQAERVAAKMKAPVAMPQAKPRRSDENVTALSSALQSHLGTKVSIDDRGQKGKIVIDYYSLDDLDRVLEILGVEI